SRCSAESESAIAAEEHDLLFAHHLLQEAEGDLRVLVFEAFRSALRLEGQVVFFTDRDVGLRTVDGRVAHRPGALTFRDITHRVVARAGDAVQRFPVRRGTGTTRALDTRNDVADRRELRIQAL